MAKNDIDEESEDDDDTFDEEISDDELEQQAKGVPPKKAKGKPVKQLPEEFEDEFGRPITPTPQQAVPQRVQQSQQQQKVKPRPQAESLPEEFRFCVPYARAAESGFMDPQTREVIAEDIPMMLALMYNKVCMIEEQIGKI